MNETTTTTLKGVDMLLLIINTQDWDSLNSNTDEVSIVEFLQDLSEGVS
tara:strand:+ start:71 stop:217 length:147 start_codon:yes stop_codon:yes gene_type:complete